MFSAEHRWPAATPVSRPCAFFFDPLFLRDSCCCFMRRAYLPMRAGSSIGADAGSRPIPSVLCQTASSCGYGTTGGADGRRPQATRRASYFGRWPPRSPDPASSSLSRSELCQASSSSATSFASRAPQGKVAMGEPMGRRLWECERVMPERANGG